MTYSKQFSFYKTDWKHHYCHGGKLRNLRRGRKQRALSTKDPLHVVFKINKSRLKGESFRSPQVYLLTRKIINIWAKYFYVKLEQVSVQNDHIHLLIRTSKRSQFHHFFRVTAGQIAQRFEKEGFLQTQKLSFQVVTHTPQSQGLGDERRSEGGEVIAGRSGMTIQSDVVLGEGITKESFERITQIKLNRPEEFWRYRPFSRVVRGYKAYRIVRDYIQLNEQEARGNIKYSSMRLRGLSSADWKVLWG